MLERILKLISGKNLTAKELCTTLNFPLTAVTDWKNEKSKPTVNQIIAMSDFFNTTTDYILLGKNTNNVIQTGDIANGDNNHATVTVSIANGDTQTRELSEIENELLKIANTLNTKNKNKLLTVAYELENSQRVGHD